MQDPPSQQEPSIRLLLPVLLCAALAAGLAAGRPPVTADEAVTVPPETLEAISCSECHREIALEWADSAHARAWIDPHYQAAIATKRRPESCHGCHIPQPLHLGDLARKPKPRAPEVEPLDHGISCASCHQGPDDTILGPFGAETDAHASVKSESFVGAGRDALCSACHRTNIGPVLGVAKDFETTGQAERGRSCVGCHMTVEFRPIAEVEGREPFEDRMGRSHRIQGPSDPGFLPRAFELSAERDGGAVRVTIANGAGHRVPGLIGREFRFDLRLVDDSGEELAREGLVFDSYDVLDPVVPTELRLAGAGSSVRVRALHVAREGARPVEFLDLELPVREAEGE